LKSMGICDNYMRLPLVPVSPGVADAIRKQMIENNFN
jgi:hypothetical protein